MEIVDFGGALDAYLTPFVESRDFSGVIVVTRADTIITTRSYGFANLEFGVPHTMHTRYWAGSISKMFTRAAVITLEKAGRLRHSDPLSDYVPDYPGSRDITIRQLVDHTAGIARDLFLGSDQTEPHTTEEILALVATIPPIGRPGETESYSNNGYRILARVIEVAGGADFATVVRDAVFAPQGMDDTLMPDLLDVVPLMASGYVPDAGSGTVRRAAYYNVFNEPGAGAFYSTPSDLVRFCRCLPLEPGDLEPADLEPADLEPAVEGEPRRVGHDGLGNGFAAYCYRFPDHDACLVMMANIETGLFDRLKQDLQLMMFGRPASAPGPPPRAVPLDRERARLYVGSYELRPGAPLLVRLGSQGLEISAGEAFHPVTPIGTDTFFMRLKFAHITFDIVDGSVASLTWQQDNAEFVLPRLPVGSES